jgi:hypothetical protein
MRPSSVFACVAIFCILAIQAALAAPPRVTCDLPRGLRDKISNEYPGTRLLIMVVLGEQGRRSFQKDHAGGCPGAVKVNFYGDGKPTWAVVLISGENPKRKAELVVAHQVGEVWEIRSLETTDGAPAVWREGPGKYKDLDGQTTIRATRPVIIFAGYGGWAVLYAWDGKGVRKIQISN